MALIFADRIKETSTSSGTDDMIMLGAVTGFRAFSTPLANSDTCYYCIEDTLGNWEIGLGTWTTASSTLTRPATPVSSSNANAKVTFPAGNKEVFIVNPATIVHTPSFYKTTVSIVSATIATTSNTDNYAIAPVTGSLLSVYFSPLVALATSDTNYITFTITNLGQAGAGTTAMLEAANSNTTKATGGTALAINTAQSLVISTTGANLLVAKGDRLLVRAAASGTLANTVTVPVYSLSFLGA
jgi:hypothetical protein